MYASLFTSFFPSKRFKSQADVSPSLSDHQAFLDTLSPPSTSSPATTFSSDSSSKDLTRDQEVQRFTESVRNVVDGLGRGRRGKGVDYGELELFLSFFPSSSTTAATSLLPRISFRDSETM